MPCSTHFDYLPHYTTQKFRASLFKGLQGAGTASLLGFGGAGVRWTPLHKQQHRPNRQERLNAPTLRRRIWENIFAVCVRGIAMRYGQRKAVRGFAAWGFCQRWQGRRRIFGKNRVSAVPKVQVRYFSAAVCCRACSVRTIASVRNITARP